MSGGELDRRIRMGCLILVLVLIGAAAAAYAAWFSQHEFSSRGWKTGDSRERGRMVSHLLSSRQLIGLTEMQVSELLGPPEFRRTIRGIRERFPHLTDEQIEQRYGTAEDNAVLQMSYPAGTFMGLPGTSWRLVHVIFEDNKVSRAVWDD